MKGQEHVRRVDEVVVVVEEEEEGEESLDDVDGMKAPFADDRLDVTVGVRNRRMSSDPDRSEEDNWSVLENHLPVVMLTAADVEKPIERRSEEADRPNGVGEGFAVLADEGEGFVAAVDVVVAVVEQMKETEEEPSNVVDWYEA